MFDFERAIAGDLPFSVAAEAWFSVKYAELGDPPDTTGTVEGRFPVPAAQVLEGLAEIVKHKLTLTYAYSTYAQTIRGPYRGELSELFQEFAEGDLSDIEYYLRRMASLGGSAQLPEIPPPPATTDAIEAVKILLRMEQEAVAKLAALKELVGENPMKAILEENMAEEQKHVDTLWQHLPYEANPQELVSQDATLEEKAASMRWRMGLRKLGEMSAREMRKLQQEQDDIDELRGTIVSTQSPEAAAFAKKKKIWGALSGGAKGGLIGGAAGLGGGVAMRRSGPALAALAALGGAAGGATGGMIGSEMAGAKAHRTIAKVSSARMLRAIKLAFDDMAQSNPGLAAAHAPTQAEDGEDRSGPALRDETKYLHGGAPPVDPALSEYIEREQSAKDEEEQSAAEYYKNIAQSATQQADSASEQMGQMQQQVGAMQQQLEQMQQQVQMTQQQAQQVQQAAVQTASLAQSTASNSQAQAIKAMQDVILHKQLAANMRQGVMAMKDQIQSVLMSDPTAGAEVQIQQAAPLSGPLPGSPGGEVPGEGSPPPDQGAAAGAPFPPTAPAGGPLSSGAPGQVPGAQGASPQAPPDQKQASAAKKMLEVAKKRAPYAVPGALVGGGATYAAIRGGAREKLQEEVNKQKQLSHAGETSTADEADLARNKMRLAYSEFAEKNPRAATAAGAGAGAAAVAAAGPPIKRIGKAVIRMAREGRR